MNIKRKIIAGLCIFSFAFSAVSCIDIEIESSDSPETSVTEAATTETSAEPETAPETEPETEIISIAESETQPETEPETLPETEPPTEEDIQIFTDDNNYVEYHFRSKKYLNQHFEKHGAEFADDFGYQTAAEYEKGASDVINNPEALYKTEAEDGDGVFYIESTNEFVILSTDGYIRTYFRPDKGIDYFNRQ